jgi:hypothetical protein
MEHAARHTRGRGQALLLAHCLALGDVDVPPRTPASERLEGVVGPELLRFLLVALTGDNRMRSDELVA